MVVLLSIKSGNETGERKETKERKKAKERKKESKRIRMMKGRNFLKSAVLLTRLSLKSAVAIITLITMSGQSVDAGWGYVDQSGWSALHDTSCGGKHQSPIDLPNVCSPVNSNVTQVNPGLNLRLINYDMQMPSSVLSLRNNGHTAVVSLKDSRKTKCLVTKNLRIRCRR